MGGGRWVCYSVSWMADSHVEDFRQTPGFVLRSASLASSYVMEGIRFGDYDSTGKKTKKCKIGVLCWGARIDPIHWTLDCWF